MSCSTKHPTKFFCTGLPASDFTVIMQLVADAAAANWTLPTAVLEAAENPEAAWAAVEQVKGLNYTERMKLREQLAQSIALPVSVCCSLIACMPCGWRYAGLAACFCSGSCRCTTLNIASASGPQIDHQNKTLCRWHRPMCLWVAHLCSRPPSLHPWTHVHIIMLGWAHCVQQRRVERGGGT